MNGYIQISVTSNEGSLTCWQQIVDGVVIGHVDDAGSPVILPSLYEAECVTGEMLAALP